MRNKLVQKIWSNSNVVCSKRWESKTLSHSASSAIQISKKVKSKSCFKHLTVSTWSILNASGNPLLKPSKPEDSSTVLIANRLYKSKNWKITSPKKRWRTSMNLNSSSTCKEIKTCRLVHAETWWKSSPATLTMQRKMMRDRRYHQQQQSICRSTESSASNVTRHSAPDAKYNHITLVRIASSLRDMQKQESVSSVTQNWQIRKRIKRK